MTGWSRWLAGGDRLVPARGRRRRLGVSQAAFAAFSRLAFVPRQVLPRPLEVSSRWRHRASGCGRCGGGPATTARSRSISTCCRCVCVACASRARGQSLGEAFARPRLYRIVQRPVPGRVSQRALVHEPGACADHHRGMAARAQRGPPEAGAGRVDARSIRAATGDGTEYPHPRTLNRTATQNGGDVAPRST